MYEYEFTIGLTSELIQYYLISRSQALKTLSQGEEPVQIVYV